MLWQVGKIGPHYKEWVHTPVNRNLRLFESDFIETFSRCPWWMVPIVWVPIILYLCHLAMSSQLSAIPMPWLPSSRPLTPLELVGLLPVGYLLWTFVEYALHRFLFHLDPPPSSPFLTTFHFLLHGQHHKVRDCLCSYVYVANSCTYLATVFNSTLCLVSRNSLSTHVRVQISLFPVLIHSWCHNIDNQMSHIDARCTFYA